MTSTEMQALIDKAQNFIDSHNGIDRNSLSPDAYGRLEAAKLYRDTLADCLGGVPDFPADSPAVKQAVAFCQKAI